MPVKWSKTSRSISAEGSTVTYWAVGTDYTVESRKRHIPHANGIGTWDHTSYFVLRGREELAEKYSLKDAKEYAEKLMGGDAT